MSWDLIVFSFPDPQSDPETGQAIIPDWGQAGPPAIATGREIRKKISQAVPDFVWEEGSGEYGKYEGTTGSIGTFVSDTDEPVSHFSLFCYGNPAQKVFELAHATGWNIYDLTSGKWMHDTDDPEEGSASYLEFARDVGTAASSQPKNASQDNVPGCVWVRVPKQGQRRQSLSEPKHRIRLRAARIL